MPARILVVIRVVVCCIIFFIPLSSLYATVFTPLSIDTSSPIIGDSFILTATASGGMVGAIYYVKCRIGQTSSSLQEGQTYNKLTQQWLDDTSAWIDMPTVTIIEDGSWQGSFPCRIKSSAVDETKVLFLRACLQVNAACGSSFQSVSSITLVPIMPTATITSTCTPTVTLTPTKIPTNTPGSTNASVIFTPTPYSSIRPTSFVRILSTVRIEEQEASSIGSVLGETKNNVEASSSALDIMGEKRPYIIALVFVSIGLAALAAVSAIKIRYTRKE